MQNHVTFRQMKKEVQESGCERVKRVNDEAVHTPLWPSTITGLDWTGLVGKGHLENKRNFVSLSLQFGTQTVSGTVTDCSFGVMSKSPV